MTDLRLLIIISLLGTFSIATNIVQALTPLLQNSATEVPVVAGIFVAAGAVLTVLGNSLFRSINDKNQIYQNKTANAFQQLNEAFAEYAADDDRKNRDFVMRVYKANMAFYPASLCQKMQKYISNSKPIDWLTMVDLMRKHGGIGSIDKNRTKAKISIADLVGK